MTASRVAGFSASRSLARRWFALVTAVAVIAVTGLRAQSYSVSTLAGSAGASGDTDGTGIAARFNLPGVVAIDPAGNVYVADRATSAVRKVTSLGVVTTLSVPATAVGGLAADGTGNLYISDYAAHVIWKVPASGVATVLAGQNSVVGISDGSGSSARFNTPRGLALDADGNLLVADSNNHTIRRVTAAGVVSTVAGLGGVSGLVDGSVSAARFRMPFALAIDGGGAVLVIDRDNRLLRKIASGEVTTVAGGGSGSLGTADGVGTAAYFNYPYAVAIDTAGNALISDVGLRTIRRVSPDRTVSTVAGLSHVSGAIDGWGAAARFSEPSGIAIDAQGNFYVADTQNHTLRKGALVIHPAIETEPVDRVVASGQSTSFTVAATGTGPFSYRWQRRVAGSPGFSNLPEVAPFSGVSTATLSIAAVTSSMHGDRYRCIVDNIAGFPATTREAALTVQSAPVITSPASATFYTGASGTFRVTMTGVPAPMLSVTSGQLPAWASLDAGTGLMTGTPNVGAGTAYSFTLTASNGVGTPVSQAFTLTVQAPPTLPAVAINGAQRLLGSVGATLLLTSSVSGTAPLTYQWKRNGLPISGATSSMLTRPNMTFHDAGYYQVAVTNPAGTTISPAVFVHVAPPSTQVFTWGVESTVPAGLTSAIAVAAGGSHALALQSGGTVVAWGSNTEGQANVPAGLGNVVQVAAGGSHSLALRADGTVVAWGLNTSGQCLIPANLNGVVAIAAGGNHSVALRFDGTVVSWGYAESGTIAVPPGLSGVVAISAASNHTLALKSDGTVVSWGYFSGYQVPSSLANVVAISAGSNTNLAVRADGTVALWGSTSWLGNVPTGLSHVISIAQSYYQGIALKSDGTVVLWGENYNSPVPFPTNVGTVLAIAGGPSLRLGIRDSSADRAPTISASPVFVASNLGQSASFSVQASAGTAALNYQWYRNGVAIAGATNATHVVQGVTASDVGSYYATVTNSLGVVTSGSAQLTVNATPVVSATTSGRYPVTSGANLTLALASSISASATVQWYRNGVLVPGATARTFSIVNATASDGGYYHAVYNEGTGAVRSGAVFVPFIPARSQVVGWGGSLGQSIPAGLYDAIAVASRGSYALALKANGSLVAWGNYYYSLPSIPAGLNNVVSLAVGQSHFAALRADGTVTTWSTSQSTPAGHTPPAGLRDVVAIAAGTQHTLALRIDGTVVAWGTENASLIAAPAGLSGVKAVAAGDGFSLALRHDGTVVGWGRNSSGQSTVPAGLSGVVAIAAGSNYSIAVKSNGTVAAWGYTNAQGAQIPAGLSDVVAIATGDSYSVALKADGTVAAWGYLGYDYYTLPMPADLSQVFAIAVGGASFALRDATGDKAPMITLQPASITALLRQTAVFEVAVDSGTAPVTFQWRKDGVAIAGATGRRLAVPVFSTTAGGNYDVLASNYLGPISSQAASLTVTATPGVTIAPGGRVAINRGQPLALSGSSALPGTVSYQWRRDGLPIAGATNASYSVAAAEWSQRGAYQLLATNHVGTAVSSPVFVQIAQPTQLRVLANSSSAPAGPPAISDAVAVAAGIDHFLALKSDGTVVAWGENGSGQTVVPAGLADIAAVAAGHRFSVALTGAGNVVTWGAINFTPAEATDVVAIAASPFADVAMALKSNGTVVTWESSGATANIPAGINPVVAITAASNNLRIALRSDGTLAQWSSSGGSIPALPANATNLVAIAAGESHRVGLRADGAVIAWGDSNYSGENNVPGNLGAVTNVVAGRAVSFALRADGSAVSWGSTSLGSVVAQRPLLALSLNQSFAVLLRDPSQDSAPTIITQPVGATVAADGSFTLSVTASGLPEPAYQWYRDGVAIYGATAATYSVAYPNSGLSGSYMVAVTNAIGTVFSDEVPVVISPNFDGRGIVSSSTHAAAGGNVLSKSFTIEGSATRSILVRGVGPALSAFGLSGTLADPALAVFNAAGVIVASNDNWGMPSGLASFIANASSQLGAFALPEGSLDAAVYRSYTPGTYHARMTGAGSGLAMLQLYDSSASGSRVVYLATHAFAGTGNRVFVEGLALSTLISGRSYLVRVLGPALDQRGALADPRFAIFNSAGQQVAANDNWSGPAVENAAAAVGASALAVGSADAALVFIPSAPGNFTIQVGGAGGAAGMVLLEVFEMDPNRATSVFPAVVLPPQPAVVLAGESVTLSSVSIGRPFPTFQWLKDGQPIDGATNSSYTIGAVSAADASAYSVRATNASGSATSPEAALSVVTQLATHSVVGPGYVPGHAVTIQNTLTFSGAAASVGWKVELPAGWSYVSSSGSAGDVMPAAGATGSIEWAWSTPPSSPFVFRYTVAVPATETGTKSLHATAIARTGAEVSPIVVDPAALAVPLAPALHRADRDGNARIDLAELTRVIELYNTRNGTTRTGAYRVDETGEDGFASDSSRGPGVAVTLTSYHSADTGGATVGSPRDGAIDVFELTRVIQLYNYRTGTLRTGSYHLQSGTEDGFAPGP